MGKDYQPKRNHYTILRAYLTRIRENDLENILDKKKESAYAAMNYGNSAQLTCLEAEWGAIDKAINNMIDHDIQLIDKAIDREE